MSCLDALKIELLAKSKVPVPGESWYSSYANPAYVRSFRAITSSSLDMMYVWNSNVLWH